MPLSLELKRSPHAPLEVDGITPDALRDKSPAEIERLLIYEGKEQTPLAEFFAIRGDGADETIEWQGDLRGVHWIGAKMGSGRMVVHGDCGRHLGSEMTGGEIHVLGSAGDFVGGEMHGGLIHVRGHAGNLVGAAYRGSARGVSQGTILIGGNAGHEIGHTMRRGLIAIGGSTGDLVGFNMLAGTILLLGDEVGIRHGAGMKRGTIAFFGRNLPPMLPSFRRACRCQALSLALLLRQLRNNDFAVAEDLAHSLYELYSGDLIEGGRGEILVRVAA
jgi:formylmethanofuran dehydrogenase subunit C